MNFGAETADDNSSTAFNASDIANGSDLLDPRMENLSNWQPMGIEAIPTTGRKCLTDFWTAPFPQGVYCNAIWDGLVCWSALSANATYTLPCPKVISQFNITEAFAHGTCSEMEVWLHGIYSLCFLEMYDRIPESMKRKIGLLKHDEQIETNEKTHLASTLMFIYFYGSIISCVLLTVTMFIFSYFKMLQCSRISIHKNLVLSFILRFLVVIVLFEPFISENRIFNGSYRDYDWLCRMMLILAYYTLLANVSWMLVEGVFLHGRVTISVFNAHPPFKTYYFIGWVLPAVIVGVWAICISESNSHPCWNNSFKMPSSWIIMAPVAVFLTLNLVFLMNIIRIMVTKLGANRTLEVNRIRKAVKATTVLFPLLGATNLLYMIDEQQGDAYRITNALLQSSQGIFVSVMYCFLNDEVKTAILRNWQKYRNRRLGTQRRSSSSAPAAKISAKNINTNYSNLDRSTQFLLSKLNAVSSSTAPPVVIHAEHFK